MDYFKTDLHLFGTHLINEKSGNPALCDKKKQLRCLQREKAQKVKGLQRMQERENAKRDVRRKPLEC